MENIKLDSEIRAGTGKSESRKIRTSGRIPATLYGQRQTPVNLTVDDASFRTILHSHPESAVIDLSIKGDPEQSVNVIVRDVQRHPASGKLLHVDFQRIRLDEKVRVEVHVTLSGDPKGVKEQGGILERGTRTININCLPGAIPESFAVDVADLMIGDSIRLQSILDDHPDIDFLDDPEMTLATVIPPTVEVKEVVEGAEEAEEAAEPEVIARESESKREGDEDKDSK
jgi:large subunit ribosomal protein L25